MDVLVSIIVPVYNTSDYLSRCVESILDQTYSEWECILVDDGSTDDSLAICQRFAERDGRVRVISQRNQGASAARNAGLDAARGEYVMFVDSDDAIGRDMVERLSRLMREQDVDVVISDVPGDAALSQSRMMPVEETLSFVVRQMWWGPYAKLFVRKSIGDLRFPKATISEDYVFVTEFLLRCKSVYYLHETHYKRERRQGSLSTLSLCDRKFEEIANVLYVRDLMAAHYPAYLQRAEQNFAETLLKLLLLIVKDARGDDYKVQERLITSHIRSFYWRFMRNPHISAKQKVLLTMGLDTKMVRVFCFLSGGRFG